MTALTEYQRLESPGVWRAAPGDQRRDVMVSVGDATLVIYDTGNRPLAHWSLAALQRKNPGKIPAVYTPGADAPEELEISEVTMLDAIETVRSAVARLRPQRGRLRSVLLAGALLAVIGLAIFWLPGALIRHTAAVVPDAKRTELGDRLLTQIHRLSGEPCATRDGTRVLEQLYARLLQGRPGGLVVLASGVSGARHLPGGMILLSRALVEDHEDPSVAAGYVLAEAARAARRDPIDLFLQEAGLMTAFRLLTTGDVADPVLEAYAETVLTRMPDPLPDEELLGVFAASTVPSTPYAYALDISGETTLGLIEADPVRGSISPVLPDGDWVTLQGICGE